MDKSFFVDALSLVLLAFVVIAPLFIARKRFPRFMSSGHDLRHMAVDAVFFSVLLAAIQVLCWMAAALALAAGGAVLDMLPGKMSPGAGSGFAFGSGVLLISLPAGMIAGTAWVCRWHLTQRRKPITGENN